jgi:ribonuclease inhibitor
MVKRFLIDCSRMTSKDTLHRYLKETLSLPEYYGSNLDALFDCLTEISEPVILEFDHLDRLIPLGNYGEALMATFRDAALENPMLTLV